jgi:hypothetical protein
LLALITACVTPPEEQEFVIKVDSVRAPAVVSVGASFDIEFFGTIGPSTCYRLKEYQLAKSSTTADITLVGAHPAESRTCGDAFTSVQGLRITISPPTADPFAVRIHQPDNTVLLKTIRVE